MRKSFQLMMNNFQIYKYNSSYNRKENSSMPYKQASSKEVVVLTTLTRDSKNGNNFISSESLLSSNQLSIGIPLFN